MENNVNNNIFVAIRNKVFINITEYTIKNMCVTIFGCSYIESV